MGGFGEAKAGAADTLIMSATNTVAMILRIPGHLLSRFWPNAPVFPNCDPPTDTRPPGSKGIFRSACSSFGGRGVVEKDLRTGTFSLSQIDLRVGGVDGFRPLRLSDQLIGQQTEVERFLEAGGADR